MKYLITVPKPCHESWADMTPEGNGRHCGSCSKVVTDFTNWDQQDILAYIKANSATGVCGRFRAEQLGVMEEGVFIRAISYSGLSLSRSIAAILLAAIGFIAVSCNNSNPPRTQTETQTQQPTTGAVSVPMPPPPPPPPPPPSIQHIDTSEVLERTTGEVEMSPVEKTKIKKHHTARHEDPAIIMPEEPGERYIMGVPPEPIPVDTSKVKNK